MRDASPEIAILIPCFNEAQTVMQVVHDFQAALPEARVYVFDNNSTDQTAALAAEAGAEVVPSPRPGKGHVVRHMFDSVKADIYLMVDGDQTYPAGAAPDLIQPIRDGQADMVIGTRLSEYSPRSFPRLHFLGNQLISRLISLTFGIRVTDVLSGYRAFSRKFIVNTPLQSKGFEIETELTLQAASKDFAIREIPIVYGARPEGSRSKLNTFTDGFLVLRTLFAIMKNYKPLVFFSWLSLFTALASITAGYLPIRDYILYEYVFRVPLAILAAALGILAVLFFGIGLILDTINQYHRETVRLLRRDPGD